jgi:hypothetical protein
MEDIRPDTLPIPTNPLPDILTEQLPSFEYRQSESVSSTTRKLPKVRPLTDHWAPEIPAVVSAPPEMSKARRIAVQQGWTDCMNPAALQKPPAMVPDLSTSASITPARLPVKVSVDPRLKPATRLSALPWAAVPPQVTPAPASTPPVAPIPITTQHNAEPISAPASSPPPTSASESSNTAEATQKLPEVSPITTTTRSHPARTGVNGVFARGQDMPWLFHVYGDNKTGMAAMMIQVRERSQKHGQRLTDRILGADRLHRSTQLRLSSSRSLESEKHISKRFGVSSDLLGSVERWYPSTGFRNVSKTIDL